MKLSSTSLSETIQSFKALISNADKPEESDRGLIAHCLNHSTSFRLPEAAKDDRLIGFRIWRRMHWSIVRNQQKNYTPGLGKSMVIQGVARNKERILRYLNFQSEENIHYFIAKDELPFKNQHITAADRRALNLYSLKIAVQCLFHSDRKNRALFPSFCLENWAICDFARKEKIERAYDFSPYLIDANLYTKSLQENGVEVSKIPSSGPLKAHNKYLLGDALALSTPYQFMEVDKFQSTIRVNRVAKWIPERALEYIQIYQNPSLPEPPKFSIGYYSHGGWLRAASGHADNGLNIPQAELALMEDLAAWLSKEPNKELLIFLHPKERQPEVMEQSEAFYKKHFAEINYRFADPGKPTSEGFHLVDLGIAVYSTVLYERLFAGYKSLIGNYGMTDFPDPNASLARICFQSREALFEQLEQSFLEDRKTFFQKNELEGYRFDSYEAAARVVNV